MFFNVFLALVDKYTGFMRLVGEEKGSCTG